MTNSTEAVTIRPATALDAVNIAKLIRHSLGADQGLLRVNDQKIVTHVLHTLETSFVAVAEHTTGRLMGSLAMTPLQQPWSDDWFMSEVWFCVRPSVHTGDTDVRLLREAETFADAQRMPMFFRVPGDDREKGALIDGRPGFSKLGTHYLRAPQGGRDVRRVSSALESSTIPG